MALDGLVTSSLVKEFNNYLVGGRVGRIFQRDKELLIPIRNKGENFNLLISVDPSLPYILISNEDRNNPSEPPQFAMVLRRHLTNGIVLSIEQHLEDRIIFINISSRDELGFIAEKRLIVEIMGRHSNLILVNPQDNKIIDSLIRVPKHMSSYRQVLPGALYILPPKQDKLRPFLIEKSDLLNLDLNSELRIDKFLYSNILGLSPLVSREIAYRANLDYKSIIRNLTDNQIDILFTETIKLLNQIKSGEIEATLIKDGDKLVDFYCIDLKMYDDINKEYFNTLSSCMSSFFHRKEDYNKRSQKSANIFKKVQTVLSREKNKLDKLELELEDSKDREKYKIYGDLISANLHLIDKSSSIIKVPNFYSENLELIEIPINPKLSPSQNAQFNYKTYSKLKNRSKVLGGQIVETKNQINYLEAVLLSIENVSNEIEVMEIEDELIDSGIIRKRKKKHKTKQSNSKPLEYVSSQGFDILVGRNNRQNDKLTMKISSRSDIWFHVQGLPGSHVIVRSNGQDLPEETILEAALLAGYYSKGKNNQSLPIDYTERKNISKPKGAKPGMVNYRNYKTITVNPSQVNIEKFNLKK